MISLQNWTKRGEWLEVRIDRKLIPSSTEEDQLAQWVASLELIPPKLLRRLQLNQGIQLKGDRLRLALFPSRELGIDPMWADLKVLYEDDFALVVHKPAGMNIHPDGNGNELTLDHAVAAYYEACGEQIAVRHIHRLDQHTSGPVLYAKNEMAQLVFDEALREKRIERIYVALVKGKVDPKLKRIEQPIGRDRHHPSRRRVSPTGQHAVTQLEVIEQYKNSTLVRLRLETGRTHQIRVHMSHLGHPLLGDVLYGGNSSLIQRQALHGEELCFSHPLTREFITVADPWPDDLSKLRQQLADFE